MPAIKPSIATAVIAVMLISACNNIANAQCNRATVIDDYNNVYLKCTVSADELNWTGSAATCTPGNISSFAQEQTLKTINYFRKLVGLPNVTMDPAQNAKCQEAALMMHSNNRLNHYPPSTWLCYTNDGAVTASQSNLSMGMHSSSAVAGYMNDEGEDNSAAGHRRWILYSKAAKFGHGATANTDVLKVIGDNGPAANVDFIAFPSSGFFPAPLLPSSNRWSFGKPGADFTNATVTMLDEKGNNIPVTQEPLKTGHGDNTIVWQPAGINATSQTDVKYTIKLSNVKVNNVNTDYTYTVTICQPTPPVCPTSQTWSDGDCGCVWSTTGIASTTKETASVANPFSAHLSILLNSDESRQIHVYDVTGKIMAKQSTEAGNRHLQIETSTWAPGMYIIDVTGNGTHTTLKAVKQ